VDSLVEGVERSGRRDPALHLGAGPDESELERRERGHDVEDVDVPDMPMRTIFPLSPPWPPATVTPERSRISRTSATPSMASGTRIAVTTAERSSSGEKSSSPIAFAPARAARPRRR
jgi:hypothetical protein